MSGSAQNAEDRAVREDSDGGGAASGGGGVVAWTAAVNGLMC